MRRGRSHLPGGLLGRHLCRRVRRLRAEQRPGPFTASVFPLCRQQGLERRPGPSPRGAGHLVKELPDTRPL